MTKTAIEWAEHVWNPVTGCTRASAGCDNCYAVTMTHRLEGMGQTEKYGGLTVLNQRGERHFNGVVRCHEDALDIPLKRRKPTTYFVNSMSDLFHKEVPFDFIDKVFAVMALCPQHTFQVLTKRPERMAEYFSRYASNLMQWAKVEDGRLIVGNQLDGDYVGWPLPNVWLGASVENELAAHRIYALRSVPTAVRFLSLEPLLGPLSPIKLTGIDWVIVGGESGKGARPCNIDWIRGIVAQCRAAGVPVFTKQLGAKPVATDGAIGSVGTWPLKLKSPKGGDPSEWPEDLRDVREMPQVREVTHG